MGRMISRKEYVAIERPEFTKPETVVKGGIALISQRTETILCSLVMDYDYEGVTLAAKESKVILRGDSGLSQWAKKVYDVNGESFVLCPLSEIIGFVK